MPSQSETQLVEAAAAAHGLQAIDESLRLLSSGRRKVLRGKFATSDNSEKVLIVRVSAPNARWSDVAPEFLIANTRSALACQPAPIAKVPTRIDEFFVSFWQPINIAERTIRVSEMGKALKSVHDNGATFNLDAFPRFDPAKTAEIALVALRSTPALKFEGEQIAVLETVVQAFADSFVHRIEQIRAASKFMPWSLVHGDWHTGNILPTVDGGVAIIDWEEGRFAPVAVDFAKLELSRRFGWAKDVPALHRAAYGVDAPSSELTQPFARFEELLMIAYSVMTATQSKAHWNETKKRLPVLFDPNSETQSWEIIGAPHVMAQNSIAVDTPTHNGGFTGP